MKYNLELLRLIAVCLITLTHSKIQFTDSANIFLFNYLPTIGTPVLTLISGYLFAEVSIKRKELLNNKIKTLLVPYLIANGSVILITLLGSAFGLHFLNRFSFSDPSIIYNGLLSFYTPPINPPTYFIRDIFVLFLIIDAFKNKHYLNLLWLIPIILFGLLFIRNDIPVLFAVGFIIARLKEKKQLMSVLRMLSIPVAVLFFMKTEVETYRYPIAISFFLLTVNLHIKFLNVGAYTYLLHLYHSPILVVLNSFALFSSPVANLMLQIVICYLIIYLLFLATRHYKPLRILCGGK